MGNRCLGLGIETTLFEQVAIKAILDGDPIVLEEELRAYSATALMKMLKMTGASTQPCLTPTCTGKTQSLRRHESPTRT